MFIKRNLFLLSVIMMLLSLNACAPRYVSPEPHYSVVQRPTQPSKMHVWVHDDWMWNRKSNNYIHRDGYWMIPQHNRIYTPGQWNKTPRGSKWQKGRWR